MSNYVKTEISPSDDALLQLLRQGDNSGYAMLYDRFGAMIYGVIKRIVIVEEDAENLLQDCFVKIWRNSDQYDSNKGKLSTWLLNIARNTAIDFTRSKVFSQRQKNQSLDILVNPSIDLGGSTTVTDTIGLRRMVQQLSPPCREVIEWMYFEGYTQQEISDNFGLPLGTVKTRARTGLLELRKYFDL